MAHWHGLAKLRLHTDYTLAFLEATTTLLGNQLRAFQTKTCSAYKTEELPREVRKREKNTGKKTKLAKVFNLETYKLHSLGDYAETIRRYGTTDSYSTELVSFTVVYSIHDNPLFNSAIYLGGTGTPHIQGSIHPNKPQIICRPDCKDRTQTSSSSTSSSPLLYSRKFCH